MCVPLPSCPLPLIPQHQSVSSARNPQVADHADRRPVGRRAYPGRNGMVVVGPIAQGSEEIVTPTPQGPACAQCARVQIPGVYRGPVRLCTNLRRNITDLLAGAVPQLALNVVTPAPHGPVRTQSTCMEHADAHRAPRGQNANLDRNSQRQMRCCRRPTAPSGRNPNTTRSRWTSARK